MGGPSAAVATGGTACVALRASFNEVIDLTREIRLAQTLVAPAGSPPACPLDNTAHHDGADLRGQVGTATLQLTVQIGFDLPPPEAAALGLGVWLHAPNDQGAIFVAGLAACNQA